MLLFGVDVPLVEIFILLFIILLLVMVEIIVIIILQLKQIRKANQLVGMLDNLAKTILEIKKSEIEELDKIK